MSKLGPSSRVVWSALAALGGAAAVGLCVAACASGEDSAASGRDGPGRKGSASRKGSVKKKKRKKKKRRKEKEAANGEEQRANIVPTAHAVELEVAAETWEAAGAYEAARGIVKSAEARETVYCSLGDPYEEEQDAEELARLGLGEVDGEDDVDLEEEDKARAARQVEVKVPEIVARLSVAGMLEAMPEQRPDEELAELMGVKVELLRFDFNSRVQQLLDKPAPTPHKQRERGEELGKLVRVYNFVAQRVGRFVVEMVRQEPSTWALKPLSKGLAGGVKFIVGKLLVKVPLAAGKAAQLFNGDQLLLHKAAGCELRALNALMEHNVPSVHAPLDVAVEVCGLEAHVMALLPIDGEESLKVGSADAGETLQCAGEGVAADAARKVAVALHLKPHRVREGSTGDVKVMQLAGDVEVHESAEDGRAYVLDVGRLLPPTTPFVDGVPLPLVHQFRPELMVELPVELLGGEVVRALSPDGFCGWGRLDCEEHHAELRAVWQVVLQRSVYVAKSVVRSKPEEWKMAALLRPPVEVGGKRALAQAFHAEGVNMRTLLVARAGLSVDEDVLGRQVLLLECAFRAVKHMARRRLLQVATMESEDVHAVMCALEAELESEGTWRGEVCGVVELLFVSHIQQVPETVREQFEADKRGLADELVEVLALVRDEASLLGRAFVASVRGGVAGVRRGEDGRWEAGASVTQVRLPAYGDVAAAVRRLEVEIEARKQTKGEQSMEVLRLQAEMLEVLENFVEEDAAGTRAKAEAVIAEIEANVGEDPERIFAVVQAGRFWSHVGETDKAFEVFDRVRGVCERAYGSDHESVGLMLNNTAAVYEAQGAYDKALELYERALAIYEAAHHPEHPSVGDTLNNMAIVYRTQGAYDKALELYERALCIKQTALGPDHPSVGDTLNNMAGVYGQQGQYDKALELYEWALAIRQAALGPDHPSVGMTLNNTGEVYRQLWAYDKALELYERALTIKQTALGPEHPSVGDTLNNMAVVYEQQEEYDKALELYERALAIRQVALGPEHPRVGDTLRDMAGVYGQQGRYEKAFELFERSMAITHAVFGPKHPTVGDTLNNMAGVCVQQGAYDKALVLYEQAVAITRATLGPKHPSVGETLNNVAGVYVQQGAFDKALEVYGRTLAIRQAALGPKHPSVGETLNHIAGVFVQRGTLDKALEVYERALAIRDVALGPEHPIVGETLNDMANVYQQQGQFGEALELYERALVIKQATLGPGHPSVGDTLNNMAGAYGQQGKYDKALEVYRRGLTIYRKALGPDHPSVGVTLNNMARFFIVTKNHSQAKIYAEHALVIFRSRLPGWHPKIAGAEEVLQLANVGLQADTDSTCSIM